MQDPWSQLSISSRHALQWAAAMARYRAERSGGDPESSAVDAFDLLVGMLLEHPLDAEPLVLLQHFQLVPGQLLPPDYPRPALETLERHLDGVWPDSQPPLEQDVQMIVQQGTELGLSTGNPDVAEMRALFAAMLESSNPVASAIGELLSQRKSSLSEIARSLREFIEGATGTDSYGEFLRQRHPFVAQPVDIPNYKADHGMQIEATDDRVDIRAEVDAFAYLLASRGLNPPLAVGLFGDWGSGKSFFMESLCNRIDALTADPAIADRPQRKVPFWKRIIQIRFNAWHYVEGELWASLVDHIFNQLRLRDEPEDLVQQRRRHWLEKLDHVRARMIRLEAQRSEAERELKAKQQQAELLRRQRDSEQANLERLRHRATADILISDSLSQVKQALAPYCLSLGVPTADEVYRKFDEARSELGRAHTLLGLMWRDSDHRALLITALIGVPALVWVLSLLDFPAVTTAFGGLAATAAAALKVLDRATVLTRSRLDRLEQVRGQVRGEVEREQAAINSRIKAAEHSIEQADGWLKKVLDEQQSLADELESLQQALAQETPTRVLNDFVAERVGSGDYRKHLGIPALIQRDFEQLSRLVARQNDEILADDSGILEREAQCFNRIILYIDDLDRCPDDRVIEVLQAVHLMLAFKLFVVVVAVDSRWLRHALTKHFKALTGNQAGKRHATPDDYLEKIFQIPFWIQPIGETARRNIIQGLLRDHLQAADGDGDDSRSGDKPTPGDAQLQALKLLDPASAPPAPAAAALSITAQELKFLDQLAPLLGETPRSTKRFVNLYQLVRIIYRLDPQQPSPALPPEHELLALVLALGEGLPDLGPRVLEAARATTDQTPLHILIDGIRTQAGADELERLELWLASRDDWRQIPASRIADALQKVDRFLFRIEGN
ncbi:hypothetical protein GCM10011348_39990 [Marinobacterium nitratireducens]|uniref:KAP NTPase domain-containing protein n=1 Tax=Marinobacterium nitratireducens TaxID=518897 RepID=A0A917ZNR9_9GAMM|nr:P-loop NTPase fold protein [Marinobacterium nitratireducens]GGO87247.1 hypothetical protein GCM10011348_39990 [Marinobacterium nitratireducens]